MNINFLKITFLLMVLMLSASVTYARQPHSIEDQIENQSKDEITLPINLTPGDNVDETDRTNGIDDDNDGLIDEGKNLGTCMITIYNTNDSPDSEWELIIDNKSYGIYRKGKARFWDLMLENGIHKVCVKSVFSTDDAGNYSIQFNSCKLVKGPNQDPFNIGENTDYTWQVQVDN